MKTPRVVCANGAAFLTDSSGVAEASRRTAVKKATKEAGAWPVGAWFKWSRGIRDICPVT